MPETIKQFDFIELDYTGALTDGTVFDTTVEDVAKKNKLYSKKRPYQPAIVCVGENQILPGLDAELIGKEVGKEYTVTLPPEKAFGKRDVKRIKIVPANTFKEHKVDPHPGLQVDIDGELGMITGVSGGRIMVNFNHPLAGKEVIYTFHVHKKIEDAAEKVSSFMAASLGLLSKNITVKVEGQTAEVGLSVDFPPQIAELFSTKLQKLTQLKEIKFVKSEKKEQ